MKLGIFGGTFNPVHYGHLRAAEEVLERLGLESVIFIPAGNPPLKSRELADAIHRYKMVRLATFKNRRFAVSDIEFKRKKKSYTVDTLRTLHSLYPRAALYFILGIDSFLDLPEWRSPDELLTLADFVVVSRPPFRFADLLTSPYIKTDQNILKRLDSGKTDSCKIRLRNGRRVIMLRLTPIGISATSIRRLIRQNSSIKYLLPEEVESYIISNKLYKK